MLSWDTLVKVQKGKDMVIRAESEVVPGPQVNCGSELQISKVHLKGYPPVKTVMENLEGCSCAPLSYAQAFGPVI